MTIYFKFYHVNIFYSAVFYLHDHYARSFGDGLRLSAWVAALAPSPLT
jgi:hypothetical protein